MRTFIYKRTHRGDPDGEGRFGIKDCMGRLRSFDFDAVIGVGGICRQAQTEGISRQLNWIGIGPRRTELDGGRGALVSFDHFLLFEDKEIYFEAIAPLLAQRLYTPKSARFLFSDQFNAREHAEAQSILRMASAAQPSRQRAAPRSLPGCHLPKMRFTKFALLAMLLAASSLYSANAQQAQDVGIIAGPYGVPRLVLDDTNKWQEPIKVFENTTMEVFIPDITGPSWAAWHVQRVGAQDFTYFVYVYTYYRNKRQTARELIYVDTRKPDRVTWQNMFQRGTTNASKNPSLVRIVAKITALVKPEADRQPSEARALQSYVHQEELAVSRMAVCSGPGVQNPDCNLSDPDFQKKYPTYSRPTPSEPSPQAPAAPTFRDDAEPDANGIYKIGGAVSGPIVIYQVEPEMPEQARQAKIGAKVLVNLDVDANGNPVNVRAEQVVLINPNGKPSSGPFKGGSADDLGFDEKAVEAVKQYRFTPAKLNGVGVPVELNVEVTFQIF